MAAAGDDRAAGAGDPAAPGPGAPSPRAGGTATRTRTKLVHSAAADGRTVAIDVLVHQ